MKLQNFKKKEKEIQINNMYQDSFKIKDEEDLMSMLSLMITDLSQEAKQQGKIEDAMHMKVKRYPVEEISDITGLSVKVIESL